MYSSVVFQMTEPTIKNIYSYLIIYQTLILCLLLITVSKATGLFKEISTISLLYKDYFGCF